MRRVGMRSVPTIQNTIPGEMVGSLRSAHPTASVLRRRRRYHLRQQRLALGLGAVALHRRGKTLEDAVLESGDDGVMDVALAADRGRVRQLVGGGAHRI